MKVKKQAGFKHFGYAPKTKGLSALTPEILQFETLKVNEDSDKNYTLPDVWLGHSLDRESNKWRQKSTGNIIEWKGWLDSCMIDKGMDLILFKLRVYVK